jgi:GTPase SAR1 family protein
MVTEIEIIEKSIEILEVERITRQNYSEAIARLKERLEFAKKQNYRMGVLGVTSSGKSTLLNALLGESLLPMDTRPTSSQLVSCGYNTKREATIFFDDSSSKVISGADLSIKTISEYADEERNPGNIKKVKQVYISMPSLELPCELELVDSPGLDAYGFPNHEKLTLNVLLPTIDFCIFITTFKTNSDEKMREILSEIAKSNKPVIVVINMYDAVCPSPDGKLSKELVADETRKRVQRIIDNSGFSNSEAVPVIYFSAKPILREREINGRSENPLYSGFIQMIRQMLAAVRQQIDSNRFITLRGELQEIVNRLKEDCKGADNAVKAALQNANKLEYDKNIFDGRHQAVIASATEQIQQLKKILDKVNQLSVCNETILKNSIQKVDTCCELLVSSFRRFNPLIEEYCNNFNLNSSDYRVRTSEPIPKFPPKVQYSEETVYERKWQDKSGVRGFFARAFGKLFGKDKWGKEEVEVARNIIVEDPVKTKQTLENYVKAIYADCYQKYTEWYQNIQAQYQSVSNVVIRIITATRKPPEEFISFDTAKRIQHELEKLIFKIPDRQIPIKNIISSPPIPYNPKAYQLTSELSSLYKMSNRIIQNLRQDIFQKSRITQFSAEKTVIISWDLNSVIQFVFHCFGVTLNDLQIIELEREHYFQYRDRLQVLYQPDNKKVRKIFSLERDVIKNITDIFILVNTVQSGQAESDIFKSEVLDILPNSAYVYFVVQNGAELFGSGNTVEGIRFMKSIQQKVQNESRIMIENENPIYQICILEVQQYSVFHQTDEIELLSELEKLTYLYYPEIRQTLADILRAFSEKR